MSKNKPAFVSDTKAKQKAINEHIVAYDLHKHPEYFEHICQQTEIFPFVSMYRIHSLEKELILHAYEGAAYSQLTLDETKQLLLLCSVSAKIENWERGRYGLWTVSEIIKHLEQLDYLHNENHPLGENVFPSIKTAIEAIRKGTNSKLVLVKIYQDCLNCLVYTEQLSLLDGIVVPDGRINLNKPVKWNTRWASVKEIVQNRPHYLKRFISNFPDLSKKI